MSQKQMVKTTQRREDEQPQEMPTTDNQARQDITESLDSLDEMIEEELSANEDVMKELERQTWWEAEKERLRKACICS